MAIKYFIGFHATNKLSSDDIIENGFSLDKIKKRENHWLGFGFYFFENIADAMSWIKTTYYCRKEPAILECRIEVDTLKCIDLDNPQVKSEFYKFFAECLETLSEAGMILEFDSREHAMCYGLNLYKESRDIDIIKRTFVNKRTAVANNYFEFGYINNDWFYDFNEVQYCVTRKNVIIETKRILVNN